MSADSPWYQRHPLTVYLTLAFTISWVGVIAVVGVDGFPGTPEDFERLIAPAVVAMLLGPSVGGIVATALTRGKEGLRDLLARGMAWHLEGKWYAAALLAAPVTVIAALAALALASPAYRPGLLSTSTPGMHLVIGLLTGVAAGFFEEIGWTGFATPLLLKRFSPNRTGLVLGVIWGAWHALASYWGSGSATDVPPALFLLVVLFAFLVPYRILMVWVYERTRSLFLAMVMHAALTGTIRILDPIGNSGREIMIFNAMMGAMMLVVIAVFANHPTHRQTASLAA